MATFELEVLLPPHPELQLQEEEPSGNTATPLSVTREEPAGRPLCAESVETPGQLTPGDHILHKIVEEPYRPVYESALVAEINPSEGKVLLFRNNLNGVTKEWVDFSALKHLHVVIYTFCRYTDEEAIGRATQRLEWGENNYNALLNNSHHFATWAKTGKEFPLQGVMKTISGQEFEANAEEADPVLSKSIVNTLEEIKPGDHVMIVTKTRGREHLLIDNVDPSHSKFSGYTCKGRKITWIEYEWILPGRTFRIDYNDVQRLFSPKGALENAQLEKACTDAWSNSDQFVTWCKTGTIYSFNDKCLYPESMVNSLEEVKPGDHVIIASKTGERDHLLINNVDPSHSKFSGYTCKGKSVNLMDYKWILPGRTFRIDYNDDRGLKSPDEALENARKCTDARPNSDQFVTWCKTGTKYSFHDKCLFSGRSNPVSLTHVSPETAIDIGDHLIVKNTNGDECSVLVYECLSQGEVLAIPDPNNPDKFCSRIDLSESHQTEIFRVNYRQSLPSGEVVARACSDKGKKVLQASGECVDRYMSWAKTGKQHPVDIPALKQQQLCIAQIRPQHRMKVLSMGDIQVGDHLIQAKPTHWFHFMVTESNIDSTNPYKIKAIYCLRTSIREEEITIDPGKQSIYKIDYPESFPTESAIERARSKLQTSGRMYSPLARQWFVRWAKTGSDEGIEVDFLANNAFPVSKSQILTFAQLNPGDYLVGGVNTKSDPSCWHHYLVTSILSPTTCSVIESWNCLIIESRVTLDPRNSYYRINYNDSACIHHECAITDAKALVGTCVVHKMKCSRQKFVNFIKTHEELFSGPDVSLDTLYDDRFFLRRERVKSALDLRPGDHVERPVALSFNRKAAPGKKPYHHMMVVEPINDRECKVLHFGGPSNFKEFKKCSVVEAKVDLFAEGEHVFRIVYHERRHPADGIAHLNHIATTPYSVQDENVDLLSCGERKYNVFTYNCENLVMKATVGRETSIQIDEKMHQALQYSKRALISGLGNAMASSATRATGKGALKASVKVCAKAIVKASNKVVARAGTRAVAQGATVDVFRIGYTAAISGTAVGLVAGVAVGVNVLIETPLFARGIYKEHRKHQFDCTSDTEYAQGVAKQSFISANTVMGGVGGALLGQVAIPVPVLGAVVGGFVGSMVGQAAGAGQGYLVSKLFNAKVINLPVVTVYMFSDFDN